VRLIASAMEIGTETTTGEQEDANLTEVAIKTLPAMTKQGNVTDVHRGAKESEMIQRS